jgi:hypothetical protein
MTATSVPATDRLLIGPARRHARRTRAAQGLPSTVTDAKALDQIAELIGDDGARGYVTERREPR